MPLLNHKLVYFNSQQ